ncbi:separin protein [Emydomyces testavorans]|uniref:separase n=1 Tax=Emydomyces testavorans TaxID=2070801 RepID=A0AAF0DIK0_9EURO|nr:separin protein [Emydomyces testavorans]
MTAQVLHPVIDSVKASVQNPSACTNDTVSLLRTLLSGAPNERKPTNRKATKGVQATSAHQATRTRNSRQAPKLTVFQIEANSAIPSLSKQNKIALATEIFNASSKTLSEYIRLQSPRPSHKGQNRHATTRCSLSPKKPLQPTSPNRAIRSPTKIKGIAERLNEPSTIKSSISGVAESAVLALSRLRDLKRNEDGRRELNLQLEQGLCILVGKLFAVGLNSAAIRELWLLRDRVQTYFDDEDPQAKTRRTAASVKNKQDAKTSERLEDLVRVPNLPEDVLMLQLFISLQNLALRAIGTEGQPSTVQKAANHLTLSNPCSPANLVLAAYKAGSLSAEKTAQQLQSLSSTILSLAALTISPGDRSPLTAKTRTKPNVTLSLQILSLEVKCLWWRIAGHQYDVDKELWDPLARYFSAFNRRCVTIKKADFECIKDAFLRLKSTLKLNGHDVSIRNVKSVSVSVVLRILGQLAYTAACLPDAIEFCKASAACLTASQPIQLAICYCKTALIQIEYLKASHSGQLPKISAAITEAAKNLTAPLKGNLADLDELVIEAAKLKKAVMKATNDLTALETKASSDTDSVWFSVVEYMMSFVRFLSRYVGPTLPPDADVDSKSIFIQRLRTCKSIALAAVDSSVAIGKLSLSTEQPPWRVTEPLLTDCVTLLNRIKCDTAMDDGNQTPGSTSNSLLKLSNLYWSRYAVQKDAGKSPFELVPLLERSISVLGSCAPTEQASGFMAIKLERLATIYAEIGHEAKAELNYSSSIRAHIRAGALEFASSSQKPPRYIWKSPQSPAFPLGRVLSSYIKARLKQPRKTVRLVYDDESLEAECRGVLLERQVELLVDLFFVNPSEDLSKSVTSAISQLLSIYTSAVFPLRRARVVLCAIRLLLESSFDFEHDFRDLLASEAKLCLSQRPELYKDQNLCPYQEDIMNSLRLTHGFYSGDLLKDDLNVVVHSWAMMAQDWTTWESVEARVSDPQIWISQLRGLADYMEVQGQWTLQITLLSVLKKALVLQEKQDLPMIVTLLSMTGLQLTRLGLAEKAGELLLGAKEMIEHHVLCPPVVISWHLAYAEYLIEINGLERSLEVLQSAKMLFDAALVDAANDSMRMRCLLDRMGIDAAYLLSRIAFVKGGMGEAAFYAKNAVKLSSRLWTRLEKYGSLRTEKHTDIAGVETDVLAEKLAAIDLSSEIDDFRKNYRAGSIYWPHFSSHCTALRQLSRVSACNGLYQDAIYYTQQALDVSKALGASYLATFIKAELGSYFIRGDQLEKGRLLLEAANAESASFEKSIHLGSLWYHVSTLHRYRGELEDECQKLDACRSVLMELPRSRFDEFFFRHNNGIAEVQSKLDELRIDTKMEPRPQRRTKRGQQSGQHGKRVEKSPVTEMIAEPKPVSLSRICYEILHRQAAVLLSDHRHHDAAVVLDEAERLLNSKNDQAAQCVQRTSLLLSEAVHKLASHSVYCVLPESCLALPSVQIPKVTGSQHSITHTSKPLKKRTKLPALNSKKPSQLLGEDFTEILSTAKQYLYAMSRFAVDHASTTDGHVFSYLISKVSALSYVTSKGSVTVDPLSTVQLKGKRTLLFSVIKKYELNFGIEIGQSSAFIREYCGIIADKQLSVPLKLPKWPLAPDAIINADLKQQSDIMKEYIDILPVSWTVISISLGVDQNEFVISKLRAGQAPFMLCLPLKRSDSEHGDEESFTFNDGKNELIEIIKLANKSAHDTRAQMDKKSKKEWWANREALDLRLTDLLHNIENIWFGGFRGIFSQKPKDEALFSRFIDSFEKTLDKHLPSRRGKRGKAKDPGFKFDRNIMELFIDIRKVSKEDEPEEFVMDLLYFVVDALQFQGERNAYDEIDFDMMVVEILDALRSYAEAERREENPSLQAHTILILDKALHSFPWESLTCLQGCSVSRMPSLHSLRGRLMDIKMRHGSTSPPHGFCIDRKSGAYVLNPSGDLKSTQNTFQNMLSKLDTWTSITQRGPSEEEFKQALESKDLVLYFGHGSGAQYIRGRTIRRLDHCAVTFLMGCSSGSMTEAGEFEPYGTPWNYMHAGSRALVATLWDVTDKDIDRFAKSVFERWGLFTGPEQKIESGGSSRQKEKKSDGEDGGLELGTPGAVGLDTAVSRSRDACVLRYLNGAAPVVYGVPVFLK